MDTRNLSGTNPMTRWVRVNSARLSSADNRLERAHAFSTFEGERQMLKEVLLDAIECWQSVSPLRAMDQRYVTSRDRLYREAHRWIFGDYCNPPFFSFTQVCDSLGLNPDFVRRRLLEWRNRPSLRSNCVPTSKLRDENSGSIFQPGDCGLIQDS